MCVPFVSSSSFASVGSTVFVRILRLLMIAGGSIAFVLRCHNRRPNQLHISTKAAFHMSAILLHCIALVSVSVLATQLRQPNCTGMLSSIHSFFRSFLLLSQSSFFFVEWILFVPVRNLSPCILTNTNYTQHLKQDESVHRNTKKKKKTKYCQTTIAGRDRKCSHFDHGQSSAARRCRVLYERRINHGQLSSVVNTRNDHQILLLLFHQREANCRIYTRYVCLIGSTYDQFDLINFPVECNQKCK